MDQETTDQNINIESLAEFSQTPPVPPQDSSLPTFSTIPKQPSRLPKMLAMAVALLLVLGLIGGAVFMIVKDDSSLVLSPLAGVDTKVDPNKDKVQAPITGEYYAQKDAVAFAKTRPLAVMINNHIDARPQSGLIYADLVYEIVAEGGITRYLAFFNTKIPEKIGPVRSTREYYLVLVKELGDAMVMHIGWSPQALEAIETWPVRSLGRGGASFWRDNPRNVATEHTAYVNGKELIDLGVELGWDGITDEFTKWDFKNDGLPTGSTATPAKHLTIDFWTPGDYSAEWTYDTESNSYLRFVGYDESGNPIAHKDQETSEQIKIKNLIVQFATETNVLDDDKGRLEYELVGTGEGLVFIDGVVYPVTWNKEERDSRTMFFTQDGKPFEFNRGKFWVAIVPDRNVDQVVYE